MMDSYDLWESRDRELARREAMLPVCDRCATRIRDEQYFEIDGEILCEECVKLRYGKYTEDYIEN